MHKVIENKAFFKTIADSLKEKESVSFKVKGKSMNPFFIDQETEVFVKEKDNYKPFDICLFELKGRFILHRLLKINHNQYIFRGDRLYQLETVEASNILGYVYQFKNNEKAILVENVSYQVKVRIYLAYKAIKMFIRKIYRGLFYGRKKKH